MTYDTEVIRKWRLKARGMRHNPRYSKRNICRLIAEKCNLPLTTIRYYVYDSRRDLKKRASSYDLKYKKVIRHIDSILPQVYNSKPELQLKEISSGIESLTGISLKESTLEKLLLKYENKPRGPPVVKTKSGNYRLNDLFYNS